jgi:hypothetical protein
LIIGGERALAPIADRRLDLLCARNRGARGRAGVVRDDNRIGRNEQFEARPISCLGTTLKQSPQLLWLAAAFARQ